MKKGIIGVLLAVLLVFSVGSIAFAGFDLSGDITHNLDDSSIGASTKVVTETDVGLLGLTFTWERDWLPSTSDTLTLKTAVGIFSLECTKKLAVADAAEATLLLSKGITEFKYVRLLDGVDSGALTITLSVAPLTFEYTRDLDADAMGTIKLSFEKSF